MEICTGSHDNALFSRIWSRACYEKSGLNVRGIYFIPLLGAAAVTEDTWRTRTQQAYIALSGPLWGLFLTAIPFVFLPLLDGQIYYFLVTVSVWWAFINLFNLLPINPLDGGRILSSISYSISGTAGITISLIAFISCLVLTFLLKVYLFAVLGIIGLVEFLNEVEISKKAKQLNFIGEIGKIKSEGLLLLRMLVRPQFRESDEKKIQKMESSRVKRLLIMAKIKPMKPLVAVKWILLYIVTSGVFISIIMSLSHHESAKIVTYILR